ncbi:MAG: hypothetical protein HW405_530 [Candidatus Berkelbacteria bacterium]|nr:hypothetical protein [Candidatus Berkelbacteria bacterium]
MIVIGGLAWYVNKNYIRYSPSEENQGFITNNKDDKKVTSNYFKQQQSRE